MVENVSALPFDRNRLDRYLKTHIEGYSDLCSIEKFAGGQSNPTYLLTTDSRQYVLRKQPPGVLLKSAHAVDREFRVISALANTDVPVAKAYHLCTDTELIGSMFYVMSFEDGRIFWTPTLEDVKPAERRAVYSEMNRVLAALHNVDIDALGLADFGRPGNYFQRQITRWSKQYRASETEHIPAMEHLLSWCLEHAPEDDGQVSLIHGDYRLDNIIFEKNSTTALALLDWELSTLGHPFSDLAYQCMQLRLPQNALVLSGLGGVRRTEMGIPTEEEYIAEYCEHRGINEIADWNFFLAFSFFRFASILQGVLKRSIDGNASSEKATAYGAMTPLLAKMGADIAA